MKKRMIGLALLVVIMLVTGGIYMAAGRTPQIITVDGYVGGEKIELLEDEEVQSILEEDYGVKADYSRAGSLDMMTADMDGMDYLFPSSSIAGEYYEDLHGSPEQSEIVLNTPIVLYTHRAVLDAFDSQGLISSSGSSYYIDMTKLVELIQNDTSWADIGLPELYGNISCHRKRRNSIWCANRSKGRAVCRATAERNSISMKKNGPRRTMRSALTHGAQNTMNRSMTPSSAETPWRSRSTRCAARSW